MINLNPNSIVLNIEEAKLDIQIKAALRIAVDTHLRQAGLEDVILHAVTTKTNIRAAFAKFVIGRVLSQPERTYDKFYVDKALEAYEAKSGHLSKSLFDRVMNADDCGPYSYKASYARHIKIGLGLFLLALHSSGAITLPSTFTWPSMREEDGQRREIGKYVSSELLKFIRRLDSQSENMPHPAFVSLGGDRKRREWFLTYGTKLLLVTGWHKPEDANVNDLLKIKSVENVINGKGIAPLAYGPLLDIFNIAFPGRISVTNEDWTQALQSNRSLSVKLNGETLKVGDALHHVFVGVSRNDHDLLEDIRHLDALWGRREKVRSLTRLPGIETDIVAISKAWLDLEDLYIRKVARESYKGINNSLGWWNVYMFYYLPQWFARNPGAKWDFPSTPSKLIKSIFISRLLEIQEATPVAFIEFMNYQAEQRNWNNNSYYASLLGLQGFFEFIERHSDAIAGCEGFTQPLDAHDFPSTVRPFHTNKKPVPRRFFKVFMDYHEVLLTYNSLILDRVLNDELTADEVRKIESNGDVIDTFAVSLLVGFIPILFTKSKSIPLQFIPNVLDTGMQTVKGGRKLLIPHPHSLHQNLVALHTGIRHNHIQWLDRDKFDSHVGIDDIEFSSLYVNTDKQKNKPWKPPVSFRVIELLRDQRKWCELIEGEDFHVQHFYNDNPRTKWSKFRPLFAYTASGAPHGDSIYSNIWKSVLCGLQGLLPKLSEFGPCPQLVYLLPAGILPDDPDIKIKLKTYGDSFKKEGESCSLRVHTESTPHTSRVSVVSQYFTFLPTDFIGNHITGQKPGTVSYYVCLEKEDLDADMANQAIRIRNEILRNAGDAISIGAEKSSTFIHADNVNASLVKGLKSNLEETIVSHGGMSISFSERSKNGVDLLREAGCAQVAFNKTEVCPYGNSCPPDIVKELNGFHRCGLCAYAVRFIDHLPAVMAKKRNVADLVDEIERLLASDEKTLNNKYTSSELDSLEYERSRLCEELSGWILNEEILEIMRQRIASGQDIRVWTVQRPEIVERDLRRVSVQTTDSEYLLARLGEAIAFPILQSPQVRARFDLLRRELLARSGKLREAFAFDAVDPTLECAGMIKSIIASTGLTISQVANILDNDIHIADLPKTQLRLLAVDDAA